ncbi:MAG TPA: hypothetical protein VE666_02005 [Mycobacterium sp.]|nr:hypothetical protein [Mycobacterium sp.]
MYPELSNGKEWPRLRSIEPFTPDNPPSCGGQSAEGFALFYCVADDYVAWDNAQAMRAVYDQGGDYAVSALLATQWGLAALTRLGDESDEKTSTLRGDCLAGGYTASVILHNRAETSTWSISPGDLDEGSRRCWCSAARATSSVRAPAGLASRRSAQASSTARRPASTTRTAECWRRTRVCVPER